jgi:GT2 family glycosyltransferase
MQVSFIIPVYNTEYQILKICINSILHCLKAQHELILIDDASSSLTTTEFLKRCNDNPEFNVKVFRNLENSGVSYSLNKGIAESQGSLIAPVDHDDLVIPAGFFAAIRYQKYFSSSWLFTDEQQVDQDGYLVNNFFKPEFSKQLLRSVMYINHLQIFSRELFSQVNGYREGFEGSQDHDLALRMSELVIPRHVPVLGYHWRIQSDTQSRNQFAVSESVTQNSITALAEHFQRQGRQASVTVARAGSSTYRARIVPDSRQKVSVIIPCRLGTKRTVNGKELILLEHCLKYLRETTNGNSSSNHPNQLLEVILVLNYDDNCQNGNQLLEKFGLSGHAIVDQSGFNFARKCNLGAEYSSGDILVFLNDDTQFLTNSWIDPVISLLTEDDVACVGGMLLNEDGSVQSCGDLVGALNANHYVPDPVADNVGDPMQRYVVDHETCSISGAFICCRSTVFSDLGKFNQAFPNSFQDVDFCLRARQQEMRCIISPSIRLLHFESSSREPTVDDETLQMLRTIHASLLSPPDSFQLWRYQPVHIARWFSLHGLLHARQCTKTFIKKSLSNVKRLTTSKPRNKFTTLIH